MEWDVQESCTADGRTGYVLERGGFVLAETTGNGTTNTVFINERGVAESIADLLNGHRLP